MRKKLIARTAKLLSESKKGRRNQGVAVAYEHIPNDIDERKHGAIYAVVNVKAPAELAEEVGEVIIDTFHSEYYQDLSRDPVASFEAALSRINEELAEITHQGNTAWLGNLHAVLAVTSDEMIHLTRTGKTEAYLYRGGRSKHATEGIEGDNINPLRTFAYTASAELLEGDKMVIATPGVFYHISKDELQKYVQEFQPKVAISHLADLLEDNTGEVHLNSILIIEAITPEAASEETVPELDDEIWIEEPNKPVKTVIEKGTPFAKKVFFYTKNGIQTITTFSTDKALPTIKKLSLEALDISKNLFKKEDTIISKTGEAIISEGKVENFEDLTINDAANEFIGTTPKENLNALYIKESVQKPKLLNIDFSSAKKLPGKLTKKLGGLHKNRRSILIAAIALVLILAVGLYSFWKINESKENQVLAQASYTEAMSKYEIGQNQLANGNKQTAANTLRSALIITESLNNNKELASQANELAGKLRTALDVAEGVIRVQTTNFADIGTIVTNDSFGPYLVGSNLYFISKNDASIASVSLNGGEVSRVLDKPNIEGKISSATSVPVRSVLVFITDAGKIYEFDTKDVKLNQQTVAGSFERSISLSSFSTNIYSLDADTSKIYKRMKNSSGYSSRTEYITDGTTVNNAVSIAIDSNVYAMKSDGTVIQYLGGRTQEYSISDIPVSIKNARLAFTSEDTIGLYELESDASRVIRFDAEGKFVNQLVSDNFRNATGIYIDDENKVLYTVSNGIVYKSSI